MSVRSIQQLFLGFILLGLAACAAPREEEPDIIVTLEPEFTVDLFEERHPDDGTPLFGLWVESMDEYPCGNFRVEAITETTGNAISVRLLDIRPPDSCQGDPAPASGFLPVGNLANGAYAFTLELSPVIRSTGTLYVQNGRYELDLTQQQGIDLQNRVLESLPDDYFWGYALTPDEQDQPLADQLVQQLKNQSQPTTLPTGYYGYFTVAGTGQFFFHRSIAPEGQHRPFLRRLNNGADAIRATLQVYRNDPVRPLEVLCWSTQGRL